MKILEALLGTSWRTTLSGYAGAIALAVLPSLQAGRWPTASELALAATVAVLGRFAKDTQQSGSGR